VRLLAALGDKLQKVIAGPGGAYAAGKRYRDRGDFRTALSAFRQAEEQWRATHIGDSTAALTQVAYCRAQLGDLTGARFDLEEALRRVRVNPNARNMPKESDVLTQLQRMNFPNK
jgi:tetratricopeptide (TPR) repeat protein